MSIKICATGDSILMSPISKDYEIDNAVSEFIGGADVRINNLEMTLTNYDCFASTFCGGTWITAEPSRLDDLCRFGFNYFSFANNHTMDYSYGGLQSTLNELERRRLPNSGAGEDLQSASRHAVVKTEKGKIGVISISATCDDAARAGNPGPMIPGRPGLNMLRHSEVFEVNGEHMRALREIAAATKINGRIDNSKKGGYTIDKPGIFSLGPVDFRLNETEGKTSRPNQNDMQRMKAAIQAAREEVDYVIVCFHSHEIRGLTDDEPDFFIEEFGRACIDWGACAAIGSGTHQIKALELYKGKPIFYSIANFIFQSSDMQQLPADYYEKYGVPLSKTAREANAVRSAGGTRGLDADYHNYRALMPLMEFEGDHLISLSLMPIELGFDGPRHLKGLPRKADAEAAQEIFSRLIRLCAPYGTKLLMKPEGVISVIV